MVGVVYIDLVVVGVAGSRIDPISDLVVEEHTVPALESVDSEHIGYRQRHRMMPNRQKLQPTTHPIQVSCIFPHPINCQAIMM
jgi:hypothetical protein